MRRSYTPEEKDFVRKMVADNYTATQISEALFTDMGINRSRNAIIGICGRMGISLGNGARSAGTWDNIPGWKPSMRTRERRAQPKPRVVKMKEDRPPPMKCAPLPFEPPTPFEPKNISVLELSANTCKWPTTAGGEYRHLFCGHKPLRGYPRPYCGYHARLDQPTR
jgi:GcrA cell cycle regulator